MCGSDLVTPRLSPVDRRSQFGEVHRHPPRLVASANSCNAPASPPTIDTPSTAHWGSDRVHQDHPPIGLTDPSVVPRPFDGAPDRKKSPAWNCGARNGRLHQGLRECLQNGNVHPFTGTPRDCASAPLRHLVRQNLVVLCISGVDVYLRRRKATAANEPHVAGPRRLTSCEPICGLLTRHPRRPIAWSRQTVLPQTRGDEASRAQVRRPSRKKTSMSGGSVPEPVSF